MTDEIKSIGAENEIDSNEIDFAKLDPNNPEVYSNPNLRRMLPPTLQMIAIINLAQSGQIVNGNETMTLEAILAGAGYQVSIDGQFSPAEMAALQNFEDKLNDKHFKEAGAELLKMVLGTDALDNPSFPTFGTEVTAHDAAMQTPSPAQTAAAKILMKLIPEI